MDISPATQFDVPQLCDLLEILLSQETEFQPDRPAQVAGLREIIRSPEIGQILVLREGSLVIGMVNLLFTVSTALGSRVAILEDMIVSPAHRGGGAGSMLLDAAIHFATSSGCRRITLLTDRSNEAARRFYSRRGFTPSEMITMRLLLQG